MTARRILRLNELIRAEIAELLAREVRDPRLASLISITRVETSPDFREARVYVSVLAEEAEAEQTVQRLRKAAGFFRRELADRLNLRRTPELDFRLDRSIAQGARVMGLLREIRRERQEE